VKELLTTCAEAADEIERLTGINKLLQQSLCTAANDRDRLHVALAKAIKRVPALPVRDWDMEEWEKLAGVTDETSDEPPVLGAGPGLAPMPTAAQAIEAHVRQIQILCDEAGLDPCEWLNDQTAQPEETATIPDGWQICPERPGHSKSVHHRGRWVDGELRCWDCPATWRPEPQSEERK
jgi:hypothetical protein